jgi:hypothetical protein
VGGQGEERRVLYDKTWCNIEGMWDIGMERERYVDKE